jgi:hypothetical protein
MPFTNVYGNGGLLTTVEDLLIWSEGFFRPSVLSQSLIDEMQTRARLNDGQSIDYGLGLVMGEFKGLSTISHGGSTAGYRAFLVRFPDPQLSIAILCNQTSAEPGLLAQRVAEILLSGQLRDPAPPKAVGVSKEALESKVGLYRNLRTDEVLRLMLANGKLFLRGGGLGLELLPAEEGRFMLPNGRDQVVFESAGGGKPSSLSITDNRSRPIVYSAVPFAAPSTRDLEGYRGRFYSEELDIVYSVELLDGRLTIHHRPEPAIPLEPAFVDAFSDARGRVVHFTRDDMGKINGFTVFTGRVRHLRFVRRD